MNKAHSSIDANLTQMSLPHALLSALIDRPCSGLELAQRFNRSIGYFWNATHQQIYRELARLENAGWIDGELVEGARGRKKSFRVLEAGRQELARWAKTDIAPLDIRDELMVRLRASASLGGTLSRQPIERLLDQHRRTLAAYEQIEARDFTASSQTQVEGLQHLVLQAGIAYERYRIDVCERALELLSASDRSSSVQ